jgi:2-polyprenyl-3-methyl-5-hydroxy-6-metoxy-1,4-benzoquinol methylase
MTILSDPENNEARALFDFANFTGKHVLEVGCGDGRLTWHYAEAAGHVTAIDPYEKAILRAKAKVPNALRDRVRFRQIPFEDFAGESDSAAFDLVIFSWAL